MFKYIALFTVCCAAPTFAQDTVVQSMPFETCVQNMQAPMTGATQPAVMTIDTGQIKEQQVQVPSGQVTVTCNGTDQTLTLKYQQ
jgi:hypothetical protein